VSETHKRNDDASAAAVANVAEGTGTGELGNRPERLAWLQDAGFGLFVHWNIDVQLGCVISHTLVGASEDHQRRYYEQLPATFNPKRWDPESIAVLARVAGMKYVTFTTKHHSGFCMWDTKTTDFNVMNTRYGRDIVAEYVDAVRAEGLAVGFYYSPEDFLFLRREGLPIRRMTLDDNGQPTRFSDSLGQPYRGRYEQLVRAQCTELMSHYGPIDVMFFDGQVGAPAKETCWTLQPNILVTRGAITTPEQTILGVATDEPWEANMTIGTAWSYKPTHEQYKSGTRMLEILIETRARGGALLLNVGPTSSGELCPEQEGRLREMGLWTFVNGEAIEGVRPWIVTNEGPVWYTRAKDADTVYAILTRQDPWPRGQRRDFLLRSLRATDETEISVLGQDDRTVEYHPDVDATARREQSDEGLAISVVRAHRLYNDSKWPNPVVVKLTHVAAALVPPAVETAGAAPAEDGTSVTLTGNLLGTGDADSVEVGFEVRPYAGFVEELKDDTWQATDMRPTTETGPFQATLTDLAAGPYQWRAVVRHPRLTMHGDRARFNL